MNGTREMGLTGRSCVKCSVLELDEQTQEANVSVSEVHWYALQTCSRHEKPVRDRLMAAGVEPFLPLSKQCRQWSDRKVWTTAPLFSGYCLSCMYWSYSVHSFLRESQASYFSFRGRNRVRQIC
ncbi:MAG: hypothetical protein E8D48_13665 [Nitrospira sp.]|nr:MAG: hypothetical protein E8D48_13665 [Nitrospira sp.]